jgi:hypothetical protein
MPPAFPTLPKVESFHTARARVVIDTYDHIYFVGYVCHATPRDVRALIGHRTLLT